MEIKINLRSVKYINYTGEFTFIRADYIRVNFAASWFASTAA
jgi:hypothetical protein